MKIKDKVVWITGGTSGMGLATAKLFLEEGAKVMITARNAERGETVAKELGPNCFFKKADMTKSDELQAAIKALIEKWGRIDVLYANAGGGTLTWCLPMQPVPESFANLEKGGQLEWTYDLSNGPGSLESYIEDIKINLIGNFDAGRLAAFEMAKNEPNEDGERGVIIYTSSISATKRHSPGFNCGYSSAKAGLSGLIKEMACNLAPLGIRVNSVMPGFFDTELIQTIGFLKTPWAEAEIFPKKAGDPKNIGQMVLAIVQNPFVNNTTIEVTAGFAGTRPQC